MAKGTPVSYKDQYWTDIISDAEQENGVIPGLLQSIVVNGERTNHDRVSPAGAKTVFQIMPATRDLFLKKYGVDAYLNDRNAAKVAALHLRESQDRNNGDARLTSREYHGGPNRKNWGPINDAYQERVVGGLDAIQSTTPQTSKLSSDFSSWLAANRTDQAEQAAADTMLAQPTQPVEATQEPSVPTEAPATADALSSDFGAWLAQNQAPQAMQAENPQVAPAEEPGFWAKAADVVTGNLRATPETESLPEWTNLPEFSHLSLPAVKAGVGTLLASPKEITQIIQSNFPDVSVRQDAKGNYILKSAENAQEYIIPPGISASDIPRALGGIAAYVAAGKVGLKGPVASRVLKGGAAAAATQGAIEASQAATGGEFNPVDVALSGVMGGTLPSLLTGVKSKIIDPAKAAIAKLIGPKSAQTVEQAIASAPTPAPVTPAPQVALPEAVEVAKTAAGGGIGSKAATSELAAMVAPDPKVLASAKRLGIEDYLQPDHITTNQAFREISQAAKSVTGSQARAKELEGLTKVAQRADDLITELGGTKDLSTVSLRVKEGLSKTQAELDDTAEKLYAELKAGINPSTKVEAPSTIKFINQQVADLGGIENLSSIERSALKKLSKNPTYALLDQVRKDVGSAARGKGEFKDADTGLAKHLYSLITDDQRVVAESKGLADVWASAKSAVSLRKSVEDDLTALFGKDLNNTLVPKIEGSMKGLAKGDTKQFVNMIKAVPEDMRSDVVASGLSTAFGKMEKLSFAGYADWFRGLQKNKQAYAALMSTLPKESRKSLIDLYRVSDGISKATRERITTGRLVHTEEMFKGGESLASKVYQAARQNAVAGAVAGTLGAINPGFGAVVGAAIAKGAKAAPLKAVDDLLVSRQFTEGVKAAAAGDVRKGAKIIAFSKPFKEFSDKLKSPIPPTEREEWIVQALQGTPAQQSNSRGQ